MNNNALLVVAIFAALVAAVSFGTVRAELMNPGVEIFTGDGVPDGQSFNIAYVVASISAVVSAAGAIGMLAGATLHPVAAWPVAGTVLLGGIWVSPLPIWAWGVPPAAPLIAAALPAVLAIFLSACSWPNLRLARRVVLIWMVVSFIVGFIAVLATTWAAREISTSGGIFLDTYLVRAAEVAAVAGCICLGLPLAIGLRRPADPKAGYRGIAIILSVGSAISFLCLVVSMLALGRLGMPTFYLDYPEAFAPWNFVASIAAFALIGFTILGLIQALLLPRAPSDAEIFA
ncbi:MAG: hypothetical protein AAF439_04940 [Pseudomonadota bacterium]